ncbi:MAG: hypothetical protein EXS50_01220 [Candidatus Taylorbacteria bacterium]|nr:hypothetical protein [Candidatus Taylorbacteria bacterium]
MFKKLIIPLFITFFFVPITHAQETCPTTGAPLTEAQRVICQRELDDVNAQIAAQDAILKNQKNQSASLSRDIAILNANIEKARLDIKAKIIQIQGFSKDITQKEVVIGTLSNKIERENESLGQLLRKSNEIETYSLPEVLLSQQNLSSFFSDLDTFDSLKKELHNSFIELSQAKTETNTQKQNLEVKRDSAADAKTSIETSKREIETNQKQLNELLGLSKKQEKNYQFVLDEQAKKAAQIRSALFALRDSVAIPFSKAFEYATYASQKTGIRPAFLLAILTQESSLGKNVGSCFVTDFNTGSGVRISTNQSVEKVMKPDRDVGIFKQLVSELGFDPLRTRVSCPLSIGWGGAMGPAQFIPSTWQLLKSRIASALGVSVPNPWEPKDAFIASAMFLSDLGASSKSYSAERNAACRYYSGSNCSKATAAPYGNQVMAKAQNIQENMINLIQNN